MPRLASVHKQSLVKKSFRASSCASVLLALWYECKYTLEMWHSHPRRDVADMCFGVHGTVQKNGVLVLREGLPIDPEGGEPRRAKKTGTDIVRGRGPIILFKSIGRCTGLG